MPMYRGALEVFEERVVIFVDRNRGTLGRVRVVIKVGRVGLRLDFGLDRSRERRTVRGEARNKG